MNDNTTVGGIEFYQIAGDIGDMVAQLKSEDEATIARLKAGQ